MLVRSWEVRHSKKSELPDPAGEGNVILQNVMKYLQTKQNHILEDLVLCSATVRPYNAYFCALQTADTVDVTAAQQ